MNTTTAHNDIAAACFVSEADNPIPLELLETSEIESYRSSLTEAELAWLDRQGFAAKSGQFAWLESDVAARVVCGWDGKDNLSLFQTEALETEFVADTGAQDACCGEHSFESVNT